MSSKRLLLFGMLLILGITLVLAIPAEAREPLGGLDLNGYCQAYGYDGATLTRDQIGVYAAYHNWKCLENGTPERFINMSSACEWQYGISSLTGWPQDPHDAYTWSCYEIP
jgi:hypothetical protein